MNLKRRDFLKIMSLSVLAPGQLMNEHSLTPNNDPATSSLKSGAKHTQDSNQIDKLYKNAIVIDALLITRDWEEKSSELALNL